MVAMQMRAADEIDVGRGQSGLLEPFEVGESFLVPFGNNRTILVVADAGVDEQRSLSRPHDIAVK